MEKIKYLTNQEIFDKVSKHLLMQNERSFENGICRYRTKNGLKCAMGIFIPDELYDISFEGRSIIPLLRKVKGFETQSKLNDSHFHLLQILQTLHDRIMSNEWKESLIKIGNKENLSLEIINNF